MADRPSRRRFLAGLAGVGSLTLGGCTFGAPRNEADLPPLGTDFESDLSGDGIPDPLVEHIEGGESASPYRKNVFVEVDRVAGVEYEEMLAFAQSVFADAPVENPDGSTGIDLHFVVDEAVPAADAPTSVRDLHFQHTEPSAFDRRHRGFRHLVVLDERYGDGWYADTFVVGVETGKNAVLVDLLAAHLAGRFDPLVEVSATATPGSDTAGAQDGPRWLPETEQATADELLDAIDWDLVEAGLPQTTPSTRWYEQKYAHLPPDSDVPPPGEQEIELGPTADEPDRDTSGDGLADRHLLNADVFAGADPYRKNVFLEVDHQQTISRDVVESRLREIQAVFARAPIRNPDGSMGIDVHYTIDDELTLEGAVTRRRIDEIEREHFDRHLKGHFYLLFIEDADDFLGFAANQGMTLVTEPQLSTPLHEFGHAIGLGSIYPGVDQTRYSFVEYPSVMNYNAPGNATVFADETGHPEAANDWEIIERQLPREQALTSLL